MRVGQRARRRDRDEDVEDRGDDERAEDRDRQVALRLLGLLARRGYRVEADVGEEDQRRGARDAREALGHERAEVVRVERREGEHEEEDQHADLIRTITVLARALSRTPAMSTPGDGEDEERGREVHRPALAGRLGDRRRQREPNSRVQHLVEVPAPAHGDGGDGDAVLEDQVPADDPRDAARPASRRRTCTRCRRPGSSSQLGVGEGGEDARHPREDEGEDDRRAGLPIASPMITKIPVPMIAPSPSADRSRSPTTRLADDPAPPPPPPACRWASG